MVFYSLLDETYTHVILSASTLCCI